MHIEAQLSLIHNRCLLDVRDYEYHVMKCAIVLKFIMPIGNTVFRMDIHKHNMSIGPHACTQTCMHACTLHTWSHAHMHASTDSDKFVCTYYYWNAEHVIYERYEIPEWMKLSGRLTAGRDAADIIGLNLVVGPAPGISMSFDNCWNTSMAW